LLAIQLWPCGRESGMEGAECRYEDERL